MDGLGVGKYFSYATQLVHLIKLQQFAIKMVKFDTFSHTVVPHTYQIKDSHHNIRPAHAYPNYTYHEVDSTFCLTNGVYVLDITM